MKERPEERWSEEQWNKNGIFFNLDSERSLANEIRSLVTKQRDAEYRAEVDIIKGYVVEKQTLTEQTMEVGNDEKQIIRQRIEVIDRYLNKPTV